MKDALQSFVKNILVDSGALILIIIYAERNGREVLI